MAEHILANPWHDESHYQSNSRMDRAPQSMQLASPRQLPLAGARAGTELGHDNGQQALPWYPAWTEASPVATSGTRAPQVPENGSARALAPRPIEQAQQVRATIDGLENVCLFVLTVFSLGLTVSLL
jgi:hypothetical protein